MMGGKKCFRKLIEIDPEAKVIVTSGYSISGQVKETLDSGAAGYIGKPYEVEILLKEIRKVLDSDDLIKSA